MSKVELRLSEKVVAEVVSLSRVFLGKNNSLGIRIASKAVSVKVRTADGEVQKQAMTPIALYTFEEGEVEIHSMYAEEMKTYPGKETIVTVCASDFFTAVGGFANISGGVTLEVDEEQQVVWLFSQGGGIRLRVSMRQPMQFSKAKTDNCVELTVDGEKFRRAVNALNGLSTGLCYDGKKLMLYGGNPAVTQFVKVLIDPKAASGKGTFKEDPKLEIAVPASALAKVSNFFKGSEITLCLMKEKLVVKDRYSWYESQLIAAPKFNSASISNVEKLGESPACQCLIKHDELMQALAPMRAATSIIRNQKSDAVYLYMEYTDNTVTLSLKDGSQVIFNLSKIQKTEEAAFKVAVDQDLFERSIGKLGNMLYLSANFSLTPGGNGSLIRMQPIVLGEDGKPMYDESITVYCVSIAYKEAYKDESAEADVEESESTEEKA